MIVRTFKDLFETVQNCDEQNGRSIVAIAGPPGVGKSTLSSRLCRQLVAGGHSAAIVQMDGFHLDNTTLETRSLRQRKGAPETFDVEGFIDLVQRLSANKGNVAVPEFDRDGDSVREDAAVVAGDCRFVLVEGNYLLLDAEPWARLQPFFNHRIFMTASMDELRARLISRWLTHGFDMEAAEAKALGNDIPNAERVLEQSLPADVVYHPMDMADLPT